MDRSPAQDARDKKRVRGVASCNRLPALVWLLGAALPAGTWAGVDLTDEVDFYGDQPIVLSASRLSQPVSSAPAAVTVIDRDMIRASGFRQLADLMRLVPGMQVAWVGGVTPAVTYHGLSSIYSRRMQVMVDGRSVYNPAYGQVHWRSLPVDLDDIERIEVVRGPNAANDGANAFQGTIHIITRPAADSHGLALSGEAGSPQVRDAGIRQGLRAGDWDWRLQASSRGDDGFDALRDESREKHFSVRGDWRPSPRDELNIWLGGADADWPLSMLGLPIQAGQVTDHKGAYGQVRFRHAMDADREWSVNLHHTETHVDVRFPIPMVNLPPPLPLTAPLDYDHWYKRSALEFQWLARPAPDLRTSLAAEIRRDQAWSRSLTGSESVLRGDMKRLSGALEWSPATDWTLHAGAMLEDHYYAGSRLSPRLAVNWHASQRHSLRLGASRGYRSPNFLEQDSDLRFEIAPHLLDQIMLSPYHLRPEVITTWELGYVFQLAERGLRGDVRLFRNRLRDTIDLASPYPVPDELMGDGADITYQNLYRAKQDGLDLQLRWQPGPDTWLVFNQAWSDTDSSSPDYTASDPQSTTSMLLAHQFGQGWQASLGYYHLDRVSWITSYGISPAYDRLDLRLARHWHAAQAHWEAALVLSSLQGDYDEYVDERYRVEPGVRIALRVHWR